MLRDSDRFKLFNRRAVMLASGKIALLSALAGRMYYLQVVESGRYKTLAEENRISLRLLPPPRGQIMDRFGAPMAMNQQNYRVVMNAENVKAAGNMLDMLGQFIKISNGEKRRIIKEFKRTRSFVPVTLRENLSWDEVARIEVNAPDLPGVTIDAGQSRYYPSAADTAHILGYVAAASENETGSDPLLELPGFRTGKSGIEKTHDLALRGAGGSSQVEVNALGRVIRELARREGVPGQEIRLTIDLGLQTMVSRRLQDESAAAVVLNVHDGDILVMASTPSFDPNSFNKRLSAGEWRNMTADSRAPLVNKAIGGHYSPGSTFKMAVALAALEKGAITSSTEFFCSGALELGEKKFHCWKEGGHGAVSLEKGIRESCDVFFYETALRTGIDRISAMGRLLGLGQKLGIDLPGEQPGLMPSRGWKQEALGSSWMQGETLLAGIGQGYMLATPLQLAVMAAQLANGGFKIKPRLTKAVGGRHPDASQASLAPPKLGLNAYHLGLIQGAMDAVVNHPLGTAYNARISKPGCEMAGKTGTIQVRHISDKEREQGVLKNSELPWKERDHALFAGYAPAIEPDYAICVLVEHGGGGAAAAAPIARDILLEAQIRDSIGLKREQPMAGGAIAPDETGRLA